MKKQIILSLLVIVVLIPNAFSLNLDDGLAHDLKSQINEGIHIYNSDEGNPTTLNILEGGIVSSDYDITAFDDSVINLMGGYVGDFISLQNKSQLSQASGTINQHLFTQDDSFALITGGTVGWIRSETTSQVEIVGGEITHEFWADADSTITIVGSDFAIDGISIDYSEVTSLLMGNPWDEPYRRLTGTLANGELIDNDFQVGHNAKIVLIPEPCSILLLGLGTLTLRRKR